MRGLHLAHAFVVLSLQTFLKLLSSYILKHYFNG